MLRTGIEKLYIRFSSLDEKMRFCLLCIVAFLYLFLGMDRNINVYDEGLILVGAERVGYGDIPHRDFYCNYGPAQFYILAALFKLFSTSVMVERIWDTLVRVAIVVLIYLIVEKLASRKTALVAFATGLVWLCAFEFYGYPIFPALLFALISVYCLRPVFNGEKTTFNLFFGGVSVGIITLFRYDIGLVTSVIETIVLSAYLFSSAQPGTLIKRTKTLLIYWGGIALLFLPVAFAYVKSSPLEDFLFDMVYYPSKYYASMRSLPFPKFYVGNNILIYLPVLVWFLSVIIIVKSRNNVDKGRFWLVVMLTLLSMAFYCKGVVRISTVHMSLSIIPALVLLAIVTEKILEFNKFIKLVSVLCVCICIFITGRILVNKVLHIKNNLIWQISSDVWEVLSSSEMPAAVGSCRPPAGLERTSCFMINKKRVDTINYLLNHTNVGEYIFSGTTRHDKVFINDIALYFMANRRSVTKWHHFDPGVQTTEDIQNMMVKEFELIKPRYIVLESEWDKISEPNKSATSSGIKILDSYIANNYREVTNFKDVKVLTRN